MYECTHVVIGSSILKINFLWLAENHSGHLYSALVIFEVWTKKRIRKAYVIVIGNSDSIGE